jgi:hypothetical protein
MGANPAKSLRVLWVIAALFAVFWPLPVVHGALAAEKGHAGIGGDFGVGLAIGDLDGDAKADVATVTVVRDGQRGTEYTIRWRLSAEPSGSIGLTAQSGGLELVLRDVNGDAAEDLVVSTALDSRVVAVLVNDGHGNFSLAQPGDFSISATQPNVFMNAPETRGVETASGLRVSFDGDASADRGDWQPASTERLRHGNREDNPRKAENSRTGRSPPGLTRTA